MTPLRALAVFCILVIVLTGLSGCIAPPKGNPPAATPAPGSGGTSGGGAKATTQQTVATPVTLVTQFVTMATPYPGATTTQSPPVREPVNVTNATTNKTPYVSIYYNSLPFRQNSTAFTYNLTMPPMVIQMCFQPNMTTHTISYISRSGTRETVTETVSYIGPDVWFEVTVRDPVTGAVVAQDGFSKSYSTDRAKKLTVYTPGNYLVELAGNDIRTDIQVLVPETSLQKGVAARVLSCGIQPPE